MSSRRSLKLQVKPVLCASLIHWAAHEITFDITSISEDFNSFFYLELQIWHGPQWSPSRSGSQSPGYYWVSGLGWSSSHCSPPGRHRQVSYTQKVKWFLVFGSVPLREITLRSCNNDIQIVINLHRRQPRPQNVAINFLIKWSGFSQIYWI